MSDLLKDKALTPEKFVANYIDNEFSKTAKMII